MEHQEKLYEQSRKGQTIQERRKADQFEQALKPKDTFENKLEKARLILPQILDEKKWSNQGRINIPDMMKLFKVSQNTAYRLRRELLKDYDQQKDARASQWESATPPKEASSSQQEEKAQ